MFRTQSNKNRSYCNKYNCNNIFIFENLDGLYLILMMFKNIFAIETASNTSNILLINPISVNPVNLKNGSNIKTNFNSLFEIFIYISTLFKYRI